MRHRATCTVFLALFPVGVSAAEPPGWSADVAPILRRHCVDCHREDGAGPFPLLTYDDARRRARQIAEVTASRYMPPWLPAPGPDFVGERRLSEEEIAALADWVEAGTPGGDDAGAPPLPPVPEWPLGEPDMVLQMAAPFSVPAAGADIFRNFVLSVPGDASHWVRTADLQVDNRRLLHHATLAIDSSDASLQLDAADPEPGFAGMEALARARVPDGHLLGWTPGKAPHPGDPEMAWALRGGESLLLEAHLLPSGRESAFRARIGLYLAEGPPSRRPVAVRLGPRTLDIPAGADDYRVADELELPVDVELQVIYPHAHYLCRSMHAEALLPSGETLTLIDIPQWSFDWQDQYRYRDPVSLPGGTRVRMEYSYDNSAHNPRNPFSPPRPVRYGPSSLDEMSDLWLQVVPRLDHQRAILSATLDRRARLQDVARWRQAVADDPDSAVMRFNLGSELVSLGETAAGIAELRRALELDPALTRAHTNLANALLATDAEASVAHFRRALELEPERAELHFNLANTLAARGAWAEAERAFLRAIELRPGYRQARLNLAVERARRGDVETGLADLRALARDAPDYPPVHYNLAQLLAASGSWEAAENALRNGLPEVEGAAPLQRLLGDLLMRRGAVQEATAAYRTAVRADPGAADARIGLALALQRSGRADEAEEQLGIALEIAPGHPLAAALRRELDASR